MSLQRGLLLYNQSRYELAEAELRQALGAEPGDAQAHALLALCLIERKQVNEAMEEARQAIHLAPDLGFAHYALSKVWYERDHYDEARTAIEEAIRLEPEDLDYRFMLGAIHFDERRWEDALRTAEAGLALDGEHPGCTNLRAMALVKLGRTSEASDTIESALARDPENTFTHANRGWTLLEESRADEAIVHFREALRLDPDNEWARAGIVEALKARNPIYAVMLRYFLWMSKLSSRAQWGVIVGGYFANRILSTAARANPDLAPWLLPLRILYGAFVLLSWTAQPVFNLLLRLNPFGRLALSREQVVESNWIGAVMLLALLSLLGCVVWGFESPFLMTLMVFGFLIIPVAGTFKASVGWPRRTMTIYTAVMAGLGLGAILAELATGGLKENSGWVFLFFGPFMLGVIGSPWVANYLMSQRVKR